VQSLDISKIDQLAKEAAELEYKTDNQKDKKDIWIEMGKELEAANYDRLKIGARVRTLIDKHLKSSYKKNDIPEKNIKFKSGHFDHIMKVQGWTDPKYDSSNVTGQRDSNSSSLTEFKSNCYEERKQDIILLDKFKRIFESLINELEIEEDEIKAGGTTTIKPRNWKEYYNKETIQLHKDLQNIVANLVEEWNQSIDKRYSLLPKMKIIAPSIVRAIATTSAFCSRHFKVLKSKTEINTKTYKKFMLDVKSYSDFMKILQEDGWKYYSLPVTCPKCNEFTLRTRLLANGTWVLVCVNKRIHVEGQPEFPATIIKELLEKISESPQKAKKIIKYYGYED